MNKNKPVIISASRATDVPAFYGEWIIDKLKKGYCKWINPFNGNKKTISFDNLRLIVFWTKNPSPFMKYLNLIDKMGYNYYFLYTVNDYEREGLEPNLPSLKKRIESFKKLSKKIGKDKVLWRFDPLILTENINVEDLIKKIQAIGEKIKNYTNRFIFSYADIEKYRKVRNNLKREGIKYRIISENDKFNIAKKINKVAQNWNLKITTCGEDIDLKKYGIYKGKCIDDSLMINNFYDDKELMKFLGVNSKLNLLNESPKNLKDKGQREECRCIESKDIGQYNTCMHLCKYCYANSSKKSVKKNFENHRYSKDTIY